MAWQGSDSQFQEFVDRYDVGGFPHISDDSGEVFSRFGIAVQPAFVIIRPDGEVQTLLGEAASLLDTMIADAL